MIQSIHRPIYTSLIKISILFAVLVFLVGSLWPWTCQALDAQCQVKPLTWLHSLLGMAGLVGLLFAAFNFFLWPTRLGRALGCTVPDLRGTWRGLLMPTQLPPGVVNPGALSVFLTVKQTTFSVEVALFTMESQSHLLSSKFTNVRGAMQLVYSYRSNPQFNPQQQTPPHFGMTVLSPEGPFPGVLQGFHYTERLSRGELKFTLHTPEVARNYKQALSLNGV